LEAYLVLLFGVVAGGCLVLFLHPKAAFVPMDGDVPREAVGQERWMFLGLSLMALGQGVLVAGAFANPPARFRFAATAALFLAGVAAMAWSLRGMRRLKQERLRMMRERHAAELARLEARPRD
jgi:hypothetical protein